MFDGAWNIISNVCVFSRLDVIYDSYIENSIKYCERQRRSNCKPLDFVNLQLNSLTLVQLDNFLASDKNKESLQKLSKIFFSSLAKDKNLNLV